MYSFYLSQFSQSTYGIHCSHFIDMHTYLIPILIFPYSYFSFPQKQLPTMIRNKWCNLSTLNANNLRPLQSIHYSLIVLPLQCFLRHDLEHQLSINFHHPINPMLFQTFQMASILYYLLGEALLHSLTKDDLDPRIQKSRRNLMSSAILVQHFRLMMVRRGQ
jgi:hypothetical protein